MNLATCPCMCNPLWWIFFVLYKCIQSTIDMFSRFSLIMHGFHGGGMFTEGTQRPAFKVLIKHLGTALVNAAIGQAVLSNAAGLISTLVGLGTWAWLDSSEGVHLLHKIGGIGFAALTIPMWYYIAVTWFHKFVLFLVLLLSMQTDMGFIGGTELSCYLASLFVGAMCMMILQFFVDMVFYSTDGLVYCYVLAAESGHDLAKGDMQEFHELIQDVKAQNAETEPFALELEPDSKPQVPTQQQIPSLPEKADAGAEGNAVV